MPGPRLAMNLPTGVSAPRAATSSMRVSPTSSKTASVSGSASRPTATAPSSCSYSACAASRSSTAMPTWSIRFTAILVVRLSERLCTERAYDADGVRGAGLELDALEQLQKLVAAQRLAVEERSRDLVERAA